jgi:RNA polymerase sigma factor (sigma-70 family)
MDGIGAARVQGVHVAPRRATVTVDDAFATFVRVHRRDAVRWATALVGDPAIGEELAHDALLAVGRRLDRIDDPPAYLRRTVVHTVTSWRRWRGREQARLVRAAARRDDLDAMPGGWSAPTRQVVAALESLPTRQRTALLLRYWADWSDDQVADALDCAPSTVRVLAHRGLATLRRILPEEDAR